MRVFGVVTHVAILLLSAMCSNTAEALHTPRSGGRLERCSVRPTSGGRSGLSGGGGGIPPPPTLKLWGGGLFDGNRNDSSRDGEEGEGELAAGALEGDQGADGAEGGASSGTGAGFADNVLLQRWLVLSPDAREDIKTTTASFLFALFVRLVLVEPRFIPSLSMYPTFDIGDQLLVNKVERYVRGGQGFNRRDVVVFHPPEAYMDLTGGNTEALIKRVVAVQGDTVEVRGRRLYINGELQEEPFTNELPDYALDTVTVPQGMLLVLGDNRNHSFDGHVWGFLPSENVIGRAQLKYWPPWRAGVVEGSQ